MFTEDIQRSDTGSLEQAVRVARSGVVRFRPGRMDKKQSPVRW